MYPKLLFYLNSIECHTTHPVRKPYDKNMKRICAAILPCNDRLLQRDAGLVPFVAREALRDLLA